MTTISSIDEDDVTALRAAVGGSVHRPSDPGYPIESFNLAVSRRPWAVVDVLDADDVAAVIRFAVANSMTVVVHNTGHGGTDVDGTSIVLRTSGLDTCEIDVENEVARVGAGVRWQQVLDAATPHGLAPLCGAAPSVGVVGFLSGGGIGPLVRSVGASSDHMRSITVVTGLGDIRTVTPEENPELFWGLRGGKATLGIITEVIIDLLPIRDIYGGAIYFDGTDAHSLIRRWRDWAAELPSTATTSLALLNLPPMPGVPPMLAGRLTVAIRFAGIGDDATHADLVAPLRTLGDPLVDAIGPMPYAAIGAIHADPPDPLPAYELGDLLRELPDPAIDALVATVGAQVPPLLTVVELRHLGGAFAEQPAVRSALCHRDAAFSLHTIGALVPPIAGQVPVAAAAAVSSVAPWSTGGLLPNFTATTDPERIRRCYDDDTYAWLSALAEQHDPQGVLRAGQVVR